MRYKIHFATKWLTRSSSYAAAALRIAVLGMAVILLGSNDLGAAQNTPPINALHDIAPKILSCWRPPHFNDEVTVRLSFTRTGALIGRPRLTYIKSSAGSGTDTEVELANSILTAIYACTPLHFTEALGMSVAGRVLTIRFIAPHPPTRNAYRQDARTSFLQA